MVKDMLLAAKFVIVARGAVKERVGEESKLYNVTKKLHKVTHRTK